MFLIGLYGVTRELVVSSSPQPWLSSLLKLRPLALPFYLTHQHVLVTIAAWASWHPHLGQSELSQGVQQSN